MGPNEERLSGLKKKQKEPKRGRTNLLDCKKLRRWTRHRKTEKPTSQHSKGGANSSRDARPKSFSGCPNVGHALRQKGRRISDLECRGRKRCRSGKRDIQDKNQSRGEEGELSSVSFREKEEEGGTWNGNKQVTHT